MPDTTADYVHQGRYCQGKSRIIVTEIATDPANEYGPDSLVSQFLTKSLPDHRNETILPSA